MEPEGFNSCCCTYLLYLDLERDGWETAAILVSEKELPGFFHAG